MHEKRTRILRGVTRNPTWPVNPWTDFVLSREPFVVGVKNRSRMRAWLMGSKPPERASKILWCAETLRVEEMTVVSLLWPEATSAADVEARARRADLDRKNAKRRGNPEYLAKVRADPKRKERYREWASKNRVKYGAAGSPEYLAAMREIGFRIAREQRERKGLPPKAVADAMRKLKSSRYHLRDLNRRIGIIERTLAREATRLNRPWHLVGYRSLSAWAAATDEGKEFQRKHWQTQTHARDARRNALPGQFTTAQWRKMMFDHEYRCAYCGRERKEFRNPAARYDLEIDHIFPIGHPLSRNDESNIVPACKGCNSGKNDEDMVSWAKRTGSFVHPWAMEKYNAIVATANIRRTA